MQNHNAKIKIEDPPTSGGRDSSPHEITASDFSIIGGVSHGVNQQKNTQEYAKKYEKARKKRQIAAKKRQNQAKRRKKNGKKRENTGHRIQETEHRMKKQSQFETAQHRIQETGHRMKKQSQLPAFGRKHEARNPPQDALWQKPADYKSA